MFEGKNRIEGLSRAKRKAKPRGAACCVVRYCWSLVVSSLVSLRIWSLSSEFSVVSCSMIVLLLIGLIASSGSLGCSIDRYGISNLSYVRASLSRSSSW